MTWHAVLKRRRVVLCLQNTSSHGTRMDMYTWQSLTTVSDNKIVSEMQQIQETIGMHTFKMSDKSVVANICIPSDECDGVAMVIGRSHPHYGHMCETQFLPLWRSASNHSNCTHCDKYAFVVYIVSQSSNEIIAVAGLSQDFMYPNSNARAPAPMYIIHEMAVSRLERGYGKCLMNVIKTFVQQQFCDDFWNLALYVNVDAYNYHYLVHFFLKQEFRHVNPVDPDTEYAIFDPHSENLMTWRRARS